MEMQTKEQLLRGVYFGSRTHSDLQKLSQDQTPLELSNYKKETKYNVTNILMNEGTQFQETKDIDFQPTVVPATMTIANLSSVAIGQLVSLKAQIVQISAVKKLKTQYGEKTKCEAFLIDPHGSIKIHLWENFTKHCDEEMTYNFKNLRLHKDVRSNELFLGTPKTGCVIEPCDPFEEKLALPSQLPDAYTTTTITTEIIGVTGFEKYHSCSQCNKKVFPDNSALVLCKHCSLKQKTKVCEVHLFVKMFVKHDDAKLTLTIFGDVLMKFLEELGKTPDIEEDVITDAILTLPDLEITFDNRSKIVSCLKLSDVKE